jgi:molybdate transport system substrate-binding protein
MEVAMVRRVRVALAAALLCLVTTACSGATPGVRPGMSVGPTGTLTVVAARSLVAILDKLAVNYTKANPLVRITVRPVASPPEPLAGTDLVAGEGISLAPIMEALVTTPVLFASDQLVIAVAPGNPKRIVGLADLVRPDVKVAVCAAQQPCGGAAEQLLADAQVAPTPAARPADGPAAIAEVAAGRVDAALVYRSDSRAANDTVGTVEFSQSRELTAEYRIAAVRTSVNAAAAQDFLTYVTSPAAADTLSAAGYRPP